MAITIWQGQVDYDPNPDPEADPPAPPEWSGDIFRAVLTDDPSYPLVVERQVIDAMGGESWMVAKEQKNRELALAYALKHAVAVYGPLITATDPGGGQ